MDNTFFELIASKVEEYVKPLGFETAEPGCFKKEDMTLSVRYDEARKSFVLGCTEPEAEEKLLSVWLFDETHRKKDAETIADDFCDCIREKLGIEKEKSVASAANVALPVRAKKEGDSLSMEQFVQRFLSVYPQYKDEYKNNVAAYGEFMPIDFFKKCGAEKLRELAKGGASKQLDKMLSVLNEFYCQGDRAVGDTIMTVFFGGAFYNDVPLFKSIIECFDDYPFLKTAAQEIVPVAAKNKKFKALFN